MEYIENEKAKALKEFTTEIETCKDYRPGGGKWGCCDKDSTCMRYKVVSLTITGFYCGVLMCCDGRITKHIVKSPKVNAFLKEHGYTC